MGKQIPMVGYLQLDDGEPHLVSNECSSCGALYFDRRNACARCGGRDFGRRKLGSTGTVRSFTIVHRAAPGVPTPYVSATVDLDGGGVVKSNLVDTDPDPGRIDLGMRVHLTTFVAGTDDDGTEAIAFGFAPEDAKEERS
jgi:uncharacterized OB-fold protein